MVVLQSNGEARAGIASCRAEHGQVCALQHTSLLRDVCPIAQCGQSNASQGPMSELYTLLGYHEPAANVKHFVAFLLFFPGNRVAH
jgi:hypothetical protein